MLWQAQLILDQAGLGVCSKVAHGTEMGRAVSQDILVLLWSESFPSSLLFGLVSPSVSPEMNLFPSPLPSLSAWHFAERTRAVLVWIGASCRIHPEEML